jgi:hypothetical protein
VPGVIIHACDYIAQNPGGECDRDLSCFEMLAGTKQVYKAFSMMGKKAAWMDISDHPQIHDLSSVVGFFFSLKVCLRLMPNGLCFAGLPCSSFVYMNSSRTKRTIKRALGDLSVRVVKEGNVLAYRVLLLTLVVMRRGVHYMIEQPGSSKLPYLPGYDCLPDLGQFGQDVVRWWMGLYGGFCPKPSLSIGSVPWLYNIKHKMTKEKKSRRTWRQVVKKAKSSTGKVTVSATPLLKKSQAYPVRFAKKIAKLHCEYMETAPKTGRKLKPADVEDFKRNWRHANLTPITNFLKEEARAGRFTPSSGIPFE